MGAPPWRDAADLRLAQEIVGRAAPEPWRPPPPPARIAAGCFVAFRRGEQGPGRAGDRAWVGVATWSERAGALDAVAVPGVATAGYEPGLLALREAPMLLAAAGPVLAGLPVGAVLLVDATGREHPRRAGLARHVGQLLDVPTVGVTHRPLLADRDPPALARRGDTAPVRLDGEPVAAWVCTVDGVRPLVAHAGWRTDVAAAVDVTLRTSTGARTPEPLRLARQAARNARAEPVGS